MPSNPDRQRFRNEDLILKVSPAVDRAKWDEGRYEGFIDELCGDREYQKDALRAALRYMLGGEYADLRALAKANYDDNPMLEARYGSWAGMERNLQLRFGQALFHQFPTAHDGLAFNGGQTNIR